MRQAAGVRDRRLHRSRRHARGPRRALLIGYYEGGRLVFSGKVGTGFTHKLAVDLRGARSHRAEGVALHAPAARTAGAQRALGETAIWCARWSSPSGRPTARSGIPRSRVCARTRRPAQVTRETPASADPPPSPASRRRCTGEGAPRPGSRRRRHHASGSRGVSRPEADQARYRALLRVNRPLDRSARRRPAADARAMSRGAWRRVLLHEAFEGVGAAGAPARTGSRRRRSSANT